MLLTDKTNENGLKYVRQSKTGNARMQYRNRSGLKQLGDNIIKIYLYGHLCYFRVNGVFVHPIFCGFECKLCCNILKLCLH